MKDKERIDSEEEHGRDCSEETIEPDEQLVELPEEEIRRLSEELEEKARECEDHQQRFLRARADLENYRRRAEKEKEDFASYANESLISEILPVVDNLERALEHAEGGGNNVESLAQGVRLTVDQMFQVLKKFGLEGIPAAGEKFDPELHHAISHEESPDAEPGTVIEEFQKGYLLKGRLVRPALVSVAKGGGDGE